MNELPAPLRAVLETPQAVPFLLETLADAEVETLELLGRALAQAPGLAVDAALLAAVRDRGAELIDRALVLLQPTFERGPSKAALTEAIALVDACADDTQARYDLGLALAGARSALGPERDLDKALDKLLAARLKNPTMQRLLTDKIRAARRG